jgi:hypothetical protein
MNIIFDADKHEYTIDGKKALGVTSTINSIPEDLMFNSAFIRKGEIGSAVHEFCHEIKCKGKKAIADIRKKAKKHHLPVMPYLEGYIKYYLETSFHVVLSEVPVGSSIWGFGGTVDDLSISPRSNLAVMDIKTTSEVSPITALQTAGYGIAVDEMIKYKVNPVYDAFKGMKVKERWCIWLDGEGGYKLVPFRDKNDLNVFLCAVSFRAWKIKNRCDNK